MIGERLAPAVNYSKALAVEEGGTIFVVYAVEVPKERVRGGIADFEGLVVKAKSPAGIVIHKRVDQVKLATKGKKIEVTFRYAIHVDPGTKKGGALELTLSLIERTGFANEVANAKLRHDLTVKPPSPTNADLLNDFRGYRVYKALAQRQANDLAQYGVRLSLSSVELPPLDRLDSAKVEKIYDFDRWRRRMGVARRHLEAAAPSNKLAKQYLDALDAPDDQVATLPGVVSAGTPPVETLTPERDPPPPPPKPKAGKDGVAELVPLEQQEKRNSGEPDQFAPRPQEPKTPVAADDKRAVAPEPIADPDGELGFERGRRETPVPLYPRALVLDDPNLGHGAWIRFSYAGVKVPRSAIAPAFFFGAETALTRDIGLDLTVPTAFINTDIERAGSLFVLGNPLLSAKYRFHLPEIEGRRPVLTARARWAIPIAPSNTIPRTRLGADLFTQEAHFADTYAFFWENNAIGLGVNAAYQISIVHLSAQMYLDDFIPVKRSDNDPRSAFFAFGYGASVGVRPLDDMLGVYLEARGTSLFAGPRRNELFTYLGVRGHFLEYLEPALWASLPVGSVSRASSFQFGAELRFTYDVEGVIVRGRGRAGETFLGDE